MNWIEFNKQNMPTPHRMCLIKRKGDSVYFGSRKDKPFVENEDISRDCYWYASPIQDNLRTDVHGDWHPYNHFQDGTVTHYCYIENLLIE